MTERGGDRVVDLGMVEPAAEPEANAGIEDLLGYEDEPASNRRRRSGRWFRTVLVVAAATAVVIAALRVVGLAVSVLAVLAGVLALIFIRRAAAVASPAPAPGGYAPGGGPGPAGRDGLSWAVGRWVRTLDWTSGDADRYDNLVRPRLAALADERLRQRHGVTLATDPTRARALLGDPLWTALTVPARRSPSPRDLAAIVDQLEQI
ncbi:hypothetical protein ACFFWC_17410 [Plantactinospora siamensis]|uniref:DUF4129 domain-containing protein n=1 Tax=Plantactinospora siamensis TaxID=555372 RepID=A0ABV6NPF3_9ACTN